MKIAPNGTPVPSDLPAISPEGRAEAIYRSARCPHCGGPTGLVLVDGTDSEGRTSSCSATCCCVHGQWIRAWHGQYDRAILDRIPDLAEILAGRDSRFVYTTSGYREDETAPRVPNREDINTMFRRPT